mmetsp:Transcript_47875/g.152761  ORF Transcript_47875/g.152761 Transcript_47875/m.152761 type:complete len:204 (+) Transcript_47875:480-1091(+)
MAWQLPQHVEMCLARQQLLQFANLKGQGLGWWHAVVDDDGCMPPFRVLVPHQSSLLATSSQQTPLHGGQVQPLAAELRKSVRAPAILQRAVWPAPGKVARAEVPDELPPCTHWQLHEGSCIPCAVRVANAADHGAGQVQLTDLALANFEQGSSRNAVPVFSKALGSFRRWSPQRELRPWDRSETCSRRSCSSWSRQPVVCVQD